MSDPRVELLLKYFFSRTDKIAFYAAWNAPQHTNGGDLLEPILNGHVRGNAAPITAVHYTNRRGSDFTKNPVRIGSYTPNTEGLTKWLCIDFDGGPEHANGLVDPKSAVIEAQKTASSFGLSSHIECSGGGQGWHLWIFFNPMVPAKQARQLGLLLCPPNQPCQNGDIGDPKSNKGMEVFPKQPRIKKDGFGNLIWLPWWWNAQPGGNQFYRIDETETLSQFLPESFTTVSPEQVDQTLTAHVRIAPESASTRRNTRSTQPPQTPKANSSEWDEWRSQALSKLPLEAIYGDYLTGNQSSPEWLECRDPASASGDQNPSAGVSTGTGSVERGSFHSFLTGETISVFDFLIQIGKAKDVKDAGQIISQLSGVPLPSKSAPVTIIGKQRPEIIVNKRQLSDILTDTWDVLLAANKPPQVFQRFEQLVAIKNRDTDNVAVLRYFNEVDTYGWMFRSARWIRYNDGEISDTNPPKDISRDVMREINPAVPRLAGIAHTPIFSSTGKLLSTPGYHSTERLWIDLPKSLIGLRVPPEPSKSEIDQARMLLCDELLCDFPFVTESDRAHLIAALFLPFVRSMFRGCGPLHLIESPTPGSGKGLLCNIISLITTGKVIAARTIPTEEEELRKVVTSFLLKAQPLVVFDNINDMKSLSSQNLATMLTAEDWSDRLLGGHDTVELANTTMWLMTGNNVRMSVELARRAARTRIDPRMEQPWLRQTFRHDDLPGWIDAHRPELIQAILTMIQAWIVAGKPLGVKKLGSFRDWSLVLGGILHNAGITGFLENLDAQYDAADPDKDIWRGFIAAWWEHYNEKPVKVSDLNSYCNDQQLLPELRGEVSSLSQQSRLARALRKILDNEIMGYRIELVKDWRVTGGKTTAYRLVASNSEASTSSEEPIDLTSELFEG